MRNDVRRVLRIQSPDFGAGLNFEVKKATSLKAIGTMKPTTFLQVVSYFNIALRFSATSSALRWRNKGSNETRFYRVSSSEIFNTNYLQKSTEYFFDLGNVSEVIQRETTTTQVVNPGGSLEPHDVNTA